MWSMKKALGEHWRFVHEFGRLFFEAKILDESARFEHALLQIIQPKLETHSKLMCQKEMQLLHPH